MYTRTHRGMKERLLLPRAGDSVVRFSSGRGGGTRSVMTAIIIVITPGTCVHAMDAPGVFA